MSGGAQHLHGLYGAVWIDADIQQQVTVDVATDRIFRIVEATGYGNSPYMCFSAFAGNPLLISPQKLFEDGLLSEDDLNHIKNWNPSQIDFGEVINYKTEFPPKDYRTFIWGDCKL